jgi:putative nucleotidyltransferase with HDIG domain
MTNTLRAPVGKTKILFVDDEPRILRGLRRKLGSMGDEWEMAFAESGPEALDILSAATVPFDAIVADMRMPGMDGAELLAEVRKQYPWMIRIVLSGHSDEESALRAAGITHQFLSKPCDTEILKSVLDRACALRDLLTDDKLRQFVSELASLPSLPSVYNELIARLQEPDASAKEIGRIVSRDVGMSAKLLQLVNSAFFGLRQRIADPVQATIYLGLNTMKSLVISVHVFNQYSGTRLGPISLAAFQRHSLTVGGLARRIAEMEGADRESVDFAFIAGLLHDLGKLVLAANLPQEYQRALARAESEGMGLPEAEREVLGANHAKVGAYLLGLWGLPGPVVEAVAFHHNPSECAGSHFSPLTAVHAANIFSLEIGPRDDEYAMIELDTDYIAQLGLTQRLATWREMCKGTLQDEEVL